MLTFMRLVVIGLLTLAPMLALGRTVTTRVTLAPSRVEVSSGEARLAGFERGVTPGQPALPEREVSIALHPRAELSSLKLEVRSGPVDSLPGRHDLAPNPPLRFAVGREVRVSWGRAGTVLGGRDLDAYGGKSRIFPRSAVEQRRISDRRGLLVLHLRYRPLRYRHATGELLLDRHTEVTVRYALRGGALSPDPQLAPHLAGLANAGEARRWYGAHAPGADTATKPGYAIIIPDALAKASTQLQPFVQHKESLGFAVTVVKDADRAAISIGPQGGDAERVRGWLQKSYQTLNLKYVLLVGNPDPRRPGVPMKNTYAYENNSHYPMVTPSDFYYAELTGNWDLNGNGKVAEYPEDKGTGGIDFAPEVIVGRMPVYDSNVPVLDQILAKTIAYATDKGDRAWRSRVLQPAAIYWFKDEYGEIGTQRIDGAEVAEIIYKQSIEPSGAPRTTLYERAGIDPSKIASDLPLTRDNVVKEWGNGYGLVLWNSHGSSTAAYRHVWLEDDGDKIPGWHELVDEPFISYDDILAVDETRPPVVFASSCLNGDPQHADNIGYGLLRHGAIGTVSATQSAVVILGSFASKLMDPHAPNIDGAERDFTALLFQKKTVGEALSITIATLSDDFEDAAWLTKLQLALYGDPSLALTTCTTDADCDDAKACNGMETCKVGQCAAGEPVKCPAADPCVDALCDESSGACSSTARPEGEACDDGTFCTVNDRCQAGTCVGQPRCAAPGNPCVEASPCDEKNRTCDVMPAAEGQTCHAGTDREGTCKAGVCEPNATGCAVAGGGESAGAGALVLVLAMLGVVAKRKRKRTGNRQQATGNRQVRGCS